MYRTLVASSRRVLSCCPRVAPTAVHNRLTSLSLEQLQQLQQLSRHTQSSLSRRLYSSDNKKPPRGTGNEDEEGREEPWIPGKLRKLYQESIDLMNQNNTIWISYYPALNEHTSFLQSTRTNSTRHLRKSANVFSTSQGSAAFSKMDYYWGASLTR